MKTFSKILIAIIFLIVGMTMVSMYDTARGLWVDSDTILNFDECGIFAKIVKDKTEILAFCDGVIFDSCSYEGPLQLKGKSYNCISCCSKDIDRCIIIFVPTDKVAL